MTLYSGDEDFIYIRADRFIEDVLLLTGRDCDANQLEWRLRQWLEEWDGAPLESMAWLDEIIADCPHPTRTRERRRYIPQATRRKVLERDGRKCVACDSTENLSLDHKHPFARGGSHSPRNLQVLCRSCNSRKHATPHQIWQRQQSKGGA